MKTENTFLNIFPQKQDGFSQRLENEEYLDYLFWLTNVEKKKRNLERAEDLIKAQSKAMSKMRPELPALT